MLVLRMAAVAAGSPGAEQEGDVPLDAERGGPSV